MRYLYLLSLLSFLLSCTSESENKSTISIEIDDFEEIQLSSEKHFFEEVINASSMVLQGDKILISEYHNVPDEQPRIHIINTRDWTYDKPKGRYGKGPLETFIPDVIPTQDPDSFWVYDYNNRKISTFSFNDSTLLASTDRKITDINYGPMRLVLIPNGNYLGVARENENKILEFDSEGNLIASYGEIELLEERPDLTKLQVSLLNNGRFNGNIQNGIYVRASIFRDLLEVFNYKTKNFFSIIGPDLKLPEFEYQESKFGRMLSIEPDVPSKYSGIAVSEHYIFALYSGYSYLDYTDSGLTAKEIRVFDLKGNPMWRFILDRSIIELGINEQTNEIYGLTTDEDPGIAVFKIPDGLLDK
ncbi:TolB-like 6-blade propeller-like [Algoriphagus locisalis]|uniref:TolB-like 6-blade propeller-like n=1 Tax=Algoriphagus locisalis TaxID=305507 RepID=A0A1I7D7E5_9BACT|nr:BF3164 family lipoprotein [Algoriphagus locisalis]SFU07525.1 TolB-like 6-blade propeller-like [Algoriphagus locisalis]